MTVQFNHTIVSARDKRASAAFLCELLGLPAARPFGCFMSVELANGVTLDYVDDDTAIVSRHFAFLVSEAEFDAIFGKIVARGMPHWADPARALPGEFNTHDGGRGVYFLDPDGHFLEILTRPYGSGESNQQPQPSDGKA